MTGGSVPLFELLTVKQAAELLYKSEQGVRRLVQAGKLETVPEGRKVLIKPESLAAYVAGLPHPPEVMEALHTARNLLGGFERFRLSFLAPFRMTFEQSRDPLARYFMAPASPLCRDILAAVKVKDYPRVLELRADLWRVSSDYRMLHEPHKTPRAKQKPGSRQEPAPVMDAPSLFPELEGGNA